MLPVLLSGSFQGSLEGLRILLVSVIGLTLDLAHSCSCFGHGQVTPPPPTKLPRSWGEGVSGS